MLLKLYWNLSVILLNFFSSLFSSSVFLYNSTPEESSVKLLCVLQAVKFEWSLQSPLVELLLRRSLESIQVAHRLFWWVQGGQGRRPFWLPTSVENSFHLVMETNPNLKSSHFWAFVKSIFINFLHDQNLPLRPLRGLNTQLNPLIIFVWCCFPRALNHQHYVWPYLFNEDFNIKSSCKTQCFERIAFLKHFMYNTKYKW